MAKKGINGIISIPSSLKGSFFKLWLQFLEPFHRLTDRELDVAAAFLKLRYELEQNISNKDLLDKIIMNYESRASIKKECGISSARLSMVLDKFRKVKFIVDNKINPKFIPKNIKKGDTSFQLLLHFNFDEEDS